MQPRISVITLGVADLERAFRFYSEGLGLPSAGIMGREFEHGAVAFFDLDGGLKLAVWAEDDIAHDTGLKKGPARPSAFTIGHNVHQRGEVDVIMQTAERAGATIVKPAQETFWGGYAGYFQDLDGHVWEVVWNPQMLPPD